MPLRVLMILLIYFYFVHGQLPIEINTIQLLPFAVSMYDPISPFILLLPVPPGQVHHEAAAQGSQLRPRQWRPSP